MAVFKKLLLLFTFFALTQATCDAPSPAFPLPNFELHKPALNATIKQIVSNIKKVLTSEYDTTSFSIEITSQTGQLSSIQHTAKTRSNLFNGGAQVIKDDTRYRIASITKPFTVLALLQLHKAGTVSLDDPVLKHLPDLVEGQTGSLPWKDITLRALMSQQAGIPRDFAQDELLNNLELKAKLGVPDIDRKGLDLPTCDEMVNYTRSCNATDFIHNIKTLLPLFAPNQHSSYSNINYDLLGIVIAKVTNTTFEDYIATKILKPLGMHQTTFHQPPDSVAAIAKGEEKYWSFYVGVQNPTGGLYSTTHDMSIFLRYVLSTYNGQTPALNWLAPTSYGGSIQTFYGVPWEIFRANLKDVVSSDLGLSGSTRPITFVTKGGGLPGYSSLIVILPEYALGITILVAGNGKALSDLRDIVTKHIIGFAELAALEELKTQYVGVYEDKSSNTRLVLGRSVEHGLFVVEWTSNGTDTFAGLAGSLAPKDAKLTLHVAPTLLFINEKEQKGERWRVLPSVEPLKKTGQEQMWGNFCPGNWDFLQYAGKPLNEIVFWRGKGEDRDVGRVEMAELTGFRRELKLVEGAMCEDGGSDELGSIGLIRQVGSGWWDVIWSFAF